MSHAPIVVVGSLNADLVVHVLRFPAPGETLTGSDFARYPGGKGANQAYGVARLGGRSQMVGQVGEDDHGAWLVQHLADGGVDVSHVQRVADRPTGVALITIDTSGQNQIVIVPGANGVLTPDRLVTAMPAIRAARVLLVQLETPLDSIMAAARAARDAGVWVVLDPAPARELPDACVAAVDLLTPNETELAALTGGGTLGDAADRRRRMAALRARGAGRVLLKAGAHGAWLLDETGEQHVPAHRVDPVDTTAAGDAFNAALAVVLAEGGSLREALSFAAAAAAVSVTRRGAQPSMPTRAEVVTFLASVPSRT